MSVKRVAVDYAYGLGDALIPLAPLPIIADRDPATNDYAQLGTTWVNRVDSSVWVLASVTNNSANWTTSPASGIGAFTSLAINPGNVNLVAGNLTLGAGNISLTSGNLAVGGNLTVGGAIAFSGDIDFTSSALIDVISTLDAAPSILLQANGGTSEQIQIHSAQGTAANAILLAADAGGITFNAALATANAFVFSSVAGGLNVDVGHQISLTTTRSAADSIEIVSSAGGIDIRATGAAAGEDIDIVATGSSVNIAASEAVVDAVTITSSNAAGGVDINSGTGGMTLDSTGAISIDAATASNFTVTGAGQDLTLASSGGSISIISTENAASAVLITTNGGTSETLVLNSAQGTGAASINLVSDAGGITLTSNLATADGINLNAIAGGVDIDGALQVNIASAQAAAANSVRIVASAADGGIDIDSGTGGMTLDSTGAISIDAAAASNFSVSGAGIDLTFGSAAGRVIVNAEEAAADAITLLSVAGGLDANVALQMNLDSSQVAADAVRIVSSNAGGGIDIDSGTAGMTLDSTGAISIDAATASNFSAAAGDLTLAAATNSVVISAAEAVIDAVQLTASSGAVQVTGGALAATTGLNIVQGAASALIQVGAGAPSHNAPQGSLYLRTDGSAVNNRAYIAVNAAGTWTALTTAA